MSRVMVTQEGQAGTYMCWPVLYPQMTGGGVMPGTETREGETEITVLEKTFYLLVSESVVQSPTLNPFKSVSPAVRGVTVKGSAMTIVSKSILSEVVRKGNIVGEEDSLSLPQIG